MSTFLEYRFLGYILCVCVCERERERERERDRERETESETERERDRERKCVVRACVLKKLQVLIFFSTGATTHCGFVFCSPLAG